MASDSNLPDKIQLAETRPVLRGSFRLLVFEVGNRRLATQVDLVRTIADYDESILIQQANPEQGSLKLNLVDLLNLYFPDEAGNQGYEKKLIVLKSVDSSLHAMIVDRVYGVGTFTDLYPVPSGIFKLPEGIITHLVVSDEPWMEVVNLQKIAEINRT